MIRLLILFQLISFSSFCQDPAHFYIGQKELANVHVYSVLQTDDLLLYIATDQGLMVYKHGKFEPIQRSPNQHGSSLFSLTKDSKNRVYCCNLQGQVFYIKNGKLELFNTIPSEDIRRNTSIMVDDQDRLVVLSKTLMWMDSNKVTYILPSEFDAATFLQKKTDGSINVPLPKNRRIVIQMGVASLKHLNIPSIVNVPISPYRFDWFVGTKSLHCYKNTSSIHTSNAIISNNSALPEGQYALLKSLKAGEQELWVSQNSGGLLKLFIDLDTLKRASVVFQNTFISHVCRGVNGTLILGTFNKGLIIVPNENVTQYNLPDDNVIRDLVILEDHSLVLSDQSGHLYRYDGEFRRFDTLTYSNNPLFYLSGFDFGVSKEIPGLYFHGKERGKDIFGSVKDIVVVDSTVLFASTSSVSRWGNFWNHLDWKLGSYDSSVFEILENTHRFRSIAFDSVYHKLLLSTASGFLIIDSSGNEQSIFYQERPIYVNDMAAFEDYIICATQQNGLLYLKNGRVVKGINRTNGLANNFVKKVVYQNHKLYVSHRSGFQIYDIKNQTWHNLGAAEGLVQGSVTDFELDGDLVWLISNGTLLSINSEQLPISSANINLQLDEVRVRDKPTSAHVFSGSENRLAFILDLHGFEYLSETQIFYRLKGLEDTWTQIENTAYPIEYRSLPAGEYIFESKAVYRGKIVSKLTYPVKIKPLFWQTTWFIILVFLFFVAISWFLYRTYDKRKSRKAKMLNELNASKLTAIQSQMNPHFIFNALNSIQDLVLKGNDEEAYTYITKFANLVRRTLNYSEKDFIEIENEIKLIELYLTLEKLRFKKKFEYTINYEELQGIMIPPLIIQPLIENALVHGLLHKEDERCLKIHFTKHDNSIECTIEDNGIGREASRLIKARRKPEHESFSLQSIQKRLHILSEQNGFDYYFNYDDLFDSNQRASGTKVTVRLPCRRMF